MQGASQAVEDGVTLAVLLEKAGKSNVPLAVQAFEKIRWVASAPLSLDNRPARSYPQCLIWTLFSYKCVRLAQLTGEITRDRWHKSKVDAKAEEIVIDRPEWLLGHDAEKHAYEVWDETKTIIERDGYHLPVLSWACFCFFVR
jgi:hypothetical protein